MNTTSPPTRSGPGMALHTGLRLASLPSAIFPIFLMIALILPHAVSPSALYVWTSAAIWVLFALGTNVLFGWSGMMSFGQAAFFGIGAYTVAMLTRDDRVVSPLILILVAALVAGMAGALFACIALRTNGVEFAVLTLVFAQVLWLLTYTVAELRGDDGFTGLAGGTLFGIDLLPDINYWYYVMGVVAVCAFGLRRIELSSFGAVLKAVRDDDLRAASLGLPVRQLRIIAYALSSAVCGIAGALIAQLQGVTTPQTLVFTVSGQALVACLIGGAAFWGPAAGAIVLIAAENFLFGGSDSPALMTGVLLLVIVLVVPGGLTSLPSLGADLRRRWLGRGGRDHTSPSDPELPVPLAGVGVSAGTSGSKGEDR
jgi:branched-chain amino acid transport system permease protein